MKIAVIGGGPGGLFFAYLMKKRDPSHEIRVYEQNTEGATYGWGVVFSDVALSFLRDADEAFYREFTAGHERCDYMEIVHKGTHVQLANNHFSRTSRIDLLTILQGACRRVGVELLFGQRVTDLSAFADADVIVAADGSNSHVRSLHAEAFRPTVEQRRNKFAWYGTNQLFHPVSLIFRETNHGIFIAHSYQYSRDLSTFLVEVDPETWQRAGLDRKSEEESRHFCSEVFRPELGSNELLSNRSLWFEARVVRSENWTHGNIVLVGDACRSVHFSLGSGTRMALQDAIALYDGFVRNGADVAAAFRHYEAVRRPASTNFQAAADKSLDWYETVGRKMHLGPVPFAYDYMRRTDRISHEALRERDPRFVAAYETQSQLAA